MALAWLIRKQKQVIFKLEETYSSLCQVLLVSINYLIQTMGLRHLDSLHNFACCCPFNANVLSFTKSWGLLLWGKNKQAKKDVVWKDAICSCTSTEKQRSSFPPGTLTRRGIFYCLRKAANRFGGRSSLPRTQQRTVGRPSPCLATFASVPIFM